MKNFLSKSFLLIISFLFVSCNQDEDVPTDQSFFNINVGSEWVYKNYYKNYNNPTQFIFSGIVDTVKIVSSENIQGYIFAKKYSKKVDVNNGNTISEVYSYVRINNLGHLIEIDDPTNFPTISETTGLVLHPGFDKNFTFNRVVSVNNTQDVYGNIIYTVHSPLNISVEGNNYLVSPYNGVFTPSENHPELVTQTVENNYSQNIGLVKNVDHTLNATTTYEKRLVSYNLN